MVERPRLRPFKAWGASNSLLQFFILTDGDLAAFAGGHERIGVGCLF
jgi:uncharacterized heparinase superfamily protein